MGGEVVYVPKPRHECMPPERAQFETIWRCECGRRWRCIRRPIPPRGMVSANPCLWVRRYWPTPGSQPGDDLPPAA